MTLRDARRGAEPFAMAILGLWLVGLSATGRL
jgi:hypothetical protein